MKKQKIKDIATVLIYAVASRLDMLAFDDTEISDNYRDVILDEIRKQCDVRIGNIELKYNAIIITSNVSDIVSEISKSNSNAKRNNHNH